MHIFVAPWSDYLHIKMILVKSISLYSRTPPGHVLCSKRGDVFLVKTSFRGLNRRLLSFDFSAGHCSHNCILKQYWSGILVIIQKNGNQ